MSVVKDILVLATGIALGSFLGGLLTVGYQVAILMRVFG